METTTIQILKTTRALLAKEKRYNPVTEKTETYDELLVRLINGEVILE